MISPKTKNQKKLQFSPPILGGSLPAGRQVRGRNKAFTLIELIVVITILAILWAISFISMDWYFAGARDSVRLTDLNNIYWQLNLIKWTEWELPLPDNYITIQASWTTIWYQWYAWASVLSTIKLDKWWKDPKDETYYTYTTNYKQNKAQLMAYFEEYDTTKLSYNSHSHNFPSYSYNSPLHSWRGVGGEVWWGLVSEVYASSLTDYSKRLVWTMWKKLWILLNSWTLTPIQDTLSTTWTLDIITTTWSYTAYFTSTDKVSGSGEVLFTNIYNRNTEFINNKTFASLDSSLVGYWDMETMNWTKLKDLSKYGNDWICYNNSVSTNCWLLWTWPQLVDGNGKSGKAMAFLAKVWNYINAWNLTNISSTETVK